MLRLFVFSLTVACAFGSLPGVYRPDLKPDMTRILKGEDAKEGEFPFIVSLNFKKNRGHACGASVITKDWALTAAHCCVTGYEMYIHSNTILLSGKGDEHEIEKYVVHPDYAPLDMWKNDICLIRVKTPFRFTNILKQVTLPPQGYRVGNNEMVTIVGWGLTEPNVFKPTLPDRLQVGRNYKALDNDVCQKEVGTKMFEGYLCVKPPKYGYGACNGDSGSPLTKNGVQVGIASWVYQPCGLGLPDFYTRLPLYIDWVKKSLGPDASQLKFARAADLEDQE